MCCKPFLRSFLHLLSLILRLSGPLYSASSNCLRSTPERLFLPLLRSKLSLHLTVQEYKIPLPLRMSMSGRALTIVSSHREQVSLVMFFIKQEWCQVGRFVNYPYCFRKLADTERKNQHENLGISRHKLGNKIPLVGKGRHTSSMDGWTLSN